MDEDQGPNQRLQLTLRAAEPYRYAHQRIDRTFLIAEPMGKVSWTKGFAAGGGALGGGIEEWTGVGLVAGNDGAA